MVGSRAWVLSGCAALFASATGCDVGQAPVSPRESVPGELSAPTEEETGPGILDRMLRTPERISQQDPAAYASQFLERLFLQGDLASALDSFQFSHPKCRVGALPCSELPSLQHRAGALAALAPTEDLIPVGMQRARFEEVVAPSVELLEPAPDKALPVTPSPQEKLVRFRDHHRLERFLLLTRAGDTWRVVSIGRADQFGAAGK